MTKHILSQDTNSLTIKNIIAKEIPFIEEEKI